MDNDKELFEELLKVDGIDPAGISDAERTAFREMLESETKRMRRLCWCNVGLVWIFSLSMLVLCVSERLLEALHIPFVVAWGGLVIALYIILLPLMFRFSKRLKASQKKARRLEFLAGGEVKRKGLIIVGRKNGKRFFHWPNIIIIVTTIWIVMFFGGAGIFWLLCKRWIFAVNPIFHIIYFTALSLSIVIYGIIAGFKIPLEELGEIDVAKYDRYKKRFIIIVTVAAIILAILIAVKYFSS